VATRGRAQGQAVIEYLGKRPAIKNQSLVGSVTAASRFEDTRKLLGDRLSTVVRDILQSNEERLHTYLTAAARTTIATIPHRNASVWQPREYWAYTQWIVARKPPNFCVRAYRNCPKQEKHWALVLRHGKSWRLSR
jgi:hypothetical protein